MTIGSPNNSTTTNANLQTKTPQIRITIFHALILSLIFAVCSALYHHGGMAHQETQVHLPYYLSDKPLLNKLYDSNMVDGSTYSARELSYLFDYFDCKFIELSVALGHPHFLSITTYVFLIGIALILWHFTVRIIGRSAFAGLAMVSLFWTSPTVFLAGNYFRSSKYGVALASATLFLLLYKVLAAQHARKELRISKSSWLTFFAVSLIATWFDRQGVFFVGLAICFLLLWNSVYPHKNNFLLLSSFGASLLVISAYNRWVGPGLTEFLNHYPAAVQYQDIPWYKLFNRPEYFVLNGFLLYIDTVRFMLGCIPAWTTMLGLAWLFGAFAIRAWKDKKSHGQPGKETAGIIAFLFCSSFLIIALNTIMLLKQTELVWLDIRRVYYWMPTVTFLSFGLALGLAHTRWVKEKTKCILLSLVILGNIYALPHHREVVENGHLQACFELSPKMLEALQKLDDPTFQPAPKVSMAPIYQHFKNRKKP